MGACFMCSTIFAGTDPEAYCLVIEGQVLNAGLKGASGVTIELSSGGQTLSTQYLSKPGKKFRLKLAKNRHYMLKLSQTGYIDKLISINTQLPEFFDDEYLFGFQTSLISKKESESLNSEILELPVALISWDMKRKLFYYDKNYSESIKREMVVQHGH